MLNNFLKITFRSLAKNKVFSIINIAGLAIGLTTCLLIMLYIFDELSYDKHQEDPEQVYRVAAAVKDDLWSAQPAPMAQALQKDLPEVEQAVRLLKFPDQDKMLLKYEHNGESRQFFETNGYYVDNGFFKIFTYDFIDGDKETALSKPGSAVISQSIASKLFDRENPIGKAIKVGLSFGESVYTVTGVFNDTKYKSHIPAKFFLSMKNNDVGGWVDQQTNWASTNIFHTYVKLRRGTDPTAFEQKLKPFFDRHAGEDLKAAGFSKRLFIQPLGDIYLHSHIGNEIAPNGNITYIYILGSIAAFILLIACINFMNLSTARSEKRAREVGVRKVIGAEKGALIRQFLGESLVMCCMALCLALLAAWLLVPAFNSITQKNLMLSSSPSLVIWIVLLTLVTGLLSGAYPAFYLSAFKPIAVLKGRIGNSMAANGIRKGLVVFQFTVSISLVLGAMVILQQLNFLQHQDLGFNTGRQLVLPLMNDQVVTKYSALKDELLKKADINSVTSGSSYPGKESILSSMLFYADGKTVNEVIDIRVSTVENDYFETLGLKLLSGRPFSREFTADSSSIILNESAIAKLGYNVQDAVGKKVHYDFMGRQTTMQIVGVVKDFNYESLHNKIKPFGFATSFFANKYSYVIVKFNSANYSKVLAEVEKTWTSVNPGIPFTYSFLDDDFKKNYQNDQRTASIVIYFTLVAIVIACLGLFGLAAFSAEQRIKEIGIRKVLGATVSGITILISKDFLKLVMLSLIIAAPLAIWVMNKWLQNFAYRIQIEWWMFAVAGALALAVALLTVSFQAIKAAISNPIKSLRSE